MPCTGPEPLPELATKTQDAARRGKAEREKLQTELELLRQQVQMLREEVAAALTAPLTTSLAGASVVPVPGAAAKPETAWAPVARNIAAAPTVLPSPAAPVPEAISETSEPEVAAAPLAEVLTTEPVLPEVPAEWAFWGCTRRCAWHRRSGFC